MFVLSKSVTYTWPVQFNAPADGGRFEKQQFDVTFKRVSQSKLKDLISDEEASDLGFCREVVVDWKGVLDENGAPVPFSQGTLEQILEVPGMGKAIVTAYLESIAGAKSKN